MIDAKNGVLISNEADDTVSLSPHRMIDIFIFMFVGVFPLLGFSPFRVEYMTEIMAFMIFAISIDLMWGYGGLLSLGHAVFFGLGAYIFAIHNNIVTSIPDFMEHHIPLLLVPLKNVVVADIAALLVPALLGFILGWFLFRGKINAVFFTIVTMIIAVMFNDIILDKTNYTDGFNGLQNVSFIFPNVGTYGQYYIVFTILLIVYFAVLKMTNSKFGTVLKGIKNNELRVKFFGYDTVSYKILTFTISSLLAGLAGMLYAGVHGQISVDDVGVTQSVLLVICVAFGGRGYITGALLGTLILEWFNNLCSEYLGGVWTAVLGVILLLVVFFMPSGIMGKVQEHFENKNFAIQKSRSQKLD